MWRETFGIEKSRPQMDIGLSGLAPASMQRDIDLHLGQLVATTPGIQTRQSKVIHPRADDDGLWFINIQDRAGEVQIESRDGMCPFLIESNFSSEPSHQTLIQIHD